MFDIKLFLVALFLAIGFLAIMCCIADFYRSHMMEKKYYRTKENKRKGVKYYD